MMADGDSSILAAAKEPYRASILREARELTCGDRHDTYGPPVENMQHIADIFNAICGRDLTATEVATLHVATKLARMRTSPTHRDSHVDGAAYLAIRYECATAERAQKADLI